MTDMPAIRLARIPDRTPVKLSLSITPILHDDLVRYAKFYEETYGRAEQVADLIPAMLAAFLEADRAFIQRHRRNMK
jgi:hypothetical protein